MRRRVHAAWRLLPVCLLVPAAAMAQEAGAGARAWPDILKDWGDPQYWLFLLVVALFGAFGGFIYELLILKGRFELPHRADDPAEGEDLQGAHPKHLYDLGILARVVIGSAAAIVVVWLLKLESQGSTAVIAGAIVAGATGIAVFRSLQDRLLAVIASRDLVRTQALAAEQTRTVEEAAAELEKLKARMARPAPAQATRGMSFELEAVQAAPAAGLAEVDNISRLLGRARAFGVAAAGGAVSVAERARAIVSQWSGADPSRVTDGRKISEIWDSNPRNPKLNDGFVSVLARDLEAAFPGVSFVLQAIPATTFGDLVVHIETS